MKRALSLVFVLLTIFDLAQAQNFFTVIAKNGVVVRRKPDVNSERIGTFNFKQNIEVIKLIEVTTTTDNNLPPTKHTKWAEIKLDNKNKGYISEQHLLKNYLNPKDYGYDAMDECNPPDCTVVSFKKFNAQIYCYRIFERYSTDLVRKDSVYVYEETAYETSNKIFEIIPKVAIDSLSVFYTKVEIIDEQVDYRKPSVRAKNWSYETWYKNTVHWKGMEEYVRLENRNNFFRLPIVEIANIEKLRKKKMALRDTLVNLSGESDNIATLVYKGKPCTFLVESVILKVVIYPKKSAPETRFIKIILSYGC